MCFEKIRDDYSKSVTDIYRYIFMTFYLWIKKDFSSQSALLCLLEKWEFAFHNKYLAEGILMDLSKVSHTRNKELLITKLHTYNHNKISLKLLLSYLTTSLWGWKKNNIPFSCWREIIKGITQGSALRPIIFNIFLSNLFFLC